MKYILYPINSLVSILGTEQEAREPQLAPLEIGNLIPYKKKKSLWNSDKLKSPDDLQTIKNSLWYILYNQDTDTFFLTSLEIWTRLESFLHQSCKADEVACKSVHKDPMEQSRHYLPLKIDLATWTQLVYLVEPWKDPHRSLKHHLVKKLFTGSKSYQLRKSTFMFPTWEYAS